MAFISYSTFHSIKLNEPTPRFSHCAAVVGGKCYLLGGFVQDFLGNGRKKLVSTVEIFDPNLETWQKYPTTGDPPPGLYDAACTSVSNSLYWFGGWDGWFFYNSLHRLDTTTLKWMELQPQNEAEGPMRKKWCGMISFSQDQLATFGGYCHPTSPIPSGATFIKNPFASGMGWSNELHVFDITRRKWSSPPTTGTRPPPSYFFSFTAINNHQAVLFGGNQPRDCRVNDYFLMDFELMHWTKLEKTEGAPWPVGRDSHAACCLNFGEEDPQLLVTGGVDESVKVTGGVDNNGNTLSDAWILDVKSRRWRELTLHEAAQTRLRHTTTAISLEPGRTRVIMFGGCPNWERGEPDYIQQKLAITAVLEFESVQSSSSGGTLTIEWVLKGVIASQGLGTPERFEEMRQRKTEHAMSDEEAQTIVDQALASGSLRQRNTVAVVVGIVGSGKTWLIHRLFRLNPPDRYTSTGIAEKSFRGLLHRIANMDSWKLLSQEDILEFLAPFLKAGLTKADIVSLAKTFTETEASQPTAAVSPAKTSIEGEAPQRTVSPAKITKDVPQPTTTDVPSPSRSHATVAQPQPEKNYATQAMINLVQTVEGYKKSFIVEFLHMVDTGGQPELIEIMPSLVHNSNFTVLVLNLAQSLDEYPPIDFHEDGRAFKRPHPSVLTNRQVIHQYARTLQAKRPTHTGTSQPSIFTVIGTHRDCVKGKLSETLAAVNKELKSIFLPAMEDELIVYRSHDEIIFPVNLLEPDDNDKVVLEQIRQKISDAHKVEEAEVPRVPVSFFMFEQNAIKYAEKKQAQDRQVMVLSFDECVHIGTELKMSSEVVRAALIYFHRYNIFLYFQDVLPNLVFLAPQVPLDFVNAIVAFSYKVKSGALPALKAKFVRFCNEGIITEEMLCDHKSLSSCFVPGIYESQHAITLFRHIYTIAELTNEEPLATSQHPVTHSSRLGQKSSTRSREYLMVSLLADKKDIVDYLPSPSKVAPLVIHFSCGCVPNGCFGNVISSLISKNNRKVCQTEEGKPACLAHNIVTLRDPMLPVTISIVNHIQHLEIHVNMAKVEEHFSEICSSIRTSTFSAIENVFKVMHFEDIQVEPAFLCPCKCSPSHAATICTFLFGGSYTVCTKTAISIGCLQKEQQFWFQKKKVVQQQQTVTLPQLILFETRSGSINILEQIGTDYWKLGVLLLEDATGKVTKAIIEQYHYDATNINLEILQRWIQGKGKLPVEWSTLVEVLKNIELVQLANEIEQNLK